MAALAWILTVFASLLLLESPLLARADDKSGGLVQHTREAEEGDNETESWPDGKSDEEWEAMKKDILDALPEDEEDKEDDDDDEEGREGRQWHITNGFPFIEYTGYLAEDPAKGHSNSTLHTGTDMTMTQAKEWCAAKAECVGFYHQGEASEGPFEKVFFKDFWKLKIHDDDEDGWTAYQKGPPISDDDVEDNHEDGAEEKTEELTAESVMKEYGMDEDAEEKKNGTEEKKDEL